MAHVSRSFRRAPKALIDPGRATPRPAQSTGNERRAESGNEELQRSSLPQLGGHPGSATRAGLKTRRYGRELAEMVRLVN
jgi:hypothetical protein